MNTLFIALLTIFIFTFHSSTLAGEDHKHEVRHGSTAKHTSHHEEDDHDEHEGHLEHEEDIDTHDDENISRIVGDMARNVGITTSTAGSQELHQTITVYGSIVSVPEQLSHVRARFEGMVKSVNVTLGERVKTGDILAEIESNESLKTYTLRSPISGRIVQHHANTGEVTKDQVLFSIANFDSVWAELRVFPAQQSSVTEGQAVHVLASNGSVKSTVDHIVPSMESPYLLARVKLANSGHILSPGLMIEARMETGRFSVPLAVVKGAVQTLGGRKGVFVKTGEDYRFTPLVLGKSDDHFYEVIDGLEVNSQYVSENSYLIKADIEKSEAEHEH